MDIAGIFQFIFSHATGIWSIVAATAAGVASWAVGKYLTPFLVARKKREIALWIVVIADEITDALVARYPNNEWTQKLDEAVDALIRICGVDEEVGKRAIEAALARKSRPAVS